MKILSNMPLLAGLLTLSMGVQSAVRFAYFSTSLIDIIGNRLGMMFYFSFGMFSVGLGLYLHFFRQDILNEPEKLRNTDMGIYSEE